MFRFQLAAESTRLLAQTMAANDSACKILYLKKWFGFSVPRALEQDAT